MKGTRGRAYDCEIRLLVRSKNDVSFDVEITSTWDWKGVFGFSLSGGGHEFR